MAVAATKSSPKGSRKTNTGNRVAAVEQPSEKGDKLGIQGGCSQEQLKKEIKEGEKFARQGGSCHQEKPKRGIKKEDRLGSYKVAAKDLRPTGDFGNRQQLSAIWGMRSKNPYASQEQPRREIMKADKLGDKAAAAAQSSPKRKSGRETSLEDKAAAATKSSSGREIMKGPKQNMPGQSTQTARASVAVAVQLVEQASHRSEVFGLLLGL